MPLCTTDRNPVALADNEYFPGVRLVKLYSPVAVVTRVVVNALVVLVSVSWAFGIAAPLVSVTVPPSEALMSCAQVTPVAGSSSIAHSTQRRAEYFLVSIASPPPNKPSVHI